MGQTDQFGTLAN